MPPPIQPSSKAAHAALLSTMQLALKLSSSAAVQVESRLVWGETAYVLGAYGSLVFRPEDTYKPLLTAGTYWEKLATPQQKGQISP
jgi:hypothetical protein